MAEDQNSTLSLQLEKCFEDLDALLVVCELERNTISKNVIEVIINNLETCVEFLLQIIPTLHDTRNDVTEIAINLQVIYRDWCRKLSELQLRYRPNCTHLAVYSICQPEVMMSDRPGRPKYIISEEVLLNLKSLGYTWQEVSSLLLVSRTTLWRRVEELGLRDRIGFSTVTDEELDQIVQSFISVHGCHVGFSMVYGHISSLGMKVQRDRVRACLRRVDPQNSRLRWATVITRRTYSVPGPNSLWHIDGHHSLINWGLVIHGCIDGFSRLICFLKCGTNNKKQTVEALFLEATEKYSWPSRIRTDHGGENVLVWQHMIGKRGEGRGSVLCGSSTQNQRIERLWRDLFRCVCSTFYYTFVAMEEEGILDRDNDLHKFILHFVFLPRINVAIDSFVNAWNRHPMRTEHNWSPEQMWVNGMVDSTNRHLLAVADVRNESEQSEDLTWFGHDPQAPLPPDDGLSTVEVNDLEINLPEELIHILYQEVDPTRESMNFGVDIYHEVMGIIENFNYKCFRLFTSRLLAIYTFRLFTIFVVGVKTNCSLVVHNNLWKRYTTRMAEPRLLLNIFHFLKIKSNRDRF